MLLFKKCRNCGRYRPLGEDNIWRPWRQQEPPPQASVVMSLCELCSAGAIRIIRGHGDGTAQAVTQEGR